MSITVFADVLLSEEVIAAGVRGKQIRKNDRVVKDSGDVDINIVWTRTLREFELGIVAMSIEAWQVLETLHEITEGGAYGFLMRDPKDCFVTAGGILVPVEGGGYQLGKRYTEPRSGRTKDRKITRPSESITVLENDDEVSATIDPLTGLVTIAGSPDASRLSWVGEFYLPVHFLDDSIDWEIVRPGSEDKRLVAGPSVVLQEIRE
jgi:uncharacterized protein (TIGR02217 family)